MARGADRARDLQPGDVVTVWASYSIPGCTGRRETEVESVADNRMYFTDVTGIRHRVSDAELKVPAPVPAAVFTVAQPGAFPRRQPGASGPLAPLGAKRMAPNMRTGRDECWGAPTLDGTWDFQRFEEEGSTWAVMHVPTGTVVKDFFGSLEACRLYVGSGEAAADLKRLSEEKAA